jgi:hypothetical protein
MSLSSPPRTHPRRDGGSGALKHTQRTLAGTVIREFRQAWSLLQIVAHAIIVVNLSKNQLLVRSQKIEIQLIT